MQACRDNLANLLRQPGNVAHPGLLLSRYLQVPAGAHGHPNARRSLYEVAIQAAQKCIELYKRAFERREAILGKMAAKARVLRVRGRLIVGLGNESVLETGITLHHTYGVPIIPGSALKGLAAHYCDQVWGQADSAGEEFRRSVVEYDEGGQKKERAGKHFQVLFGTTDETGYISFHDAWIVPDSLGCQNEGMVLDVLTPHHGDYYSGKTYSGGPEEGKRIPPTDFDDPNLVSFLSVAGRFHVAVSCGDSSDPGHEWQDLALKLLLDALEHWGVGGKTSSGYGRLAEIV